MAFEHRIRVSARTLRMRSGLMAVIRAGVVEDVHKRPDEGGEKLQLCEATRAHSAAQAIRWRFPRTGPSLSRDRTMIKVWGRVPSNRTSLAEPDRILNRLLGFRVIEYV
jgi:hypothetical protein